MEKMIIKMISDQVSKLIGDQFHRPSNVHGKTGPKSNYPSYSNIHRVPKLAAPLEIS